MQITILGIALPSKKGYQRNRYFDMYQMGAERDGRRGEVSPYVDVCFRYQLFLQIKDDILAGRLECPFDYAVELGALALQCKSYHAL